MLFRQRQAPCNKLTVARWGVLAPLVTTQKSGARRLGADWTDLCWVGSSAGWLLSLQGMVQWAQEMNEGHYSMTTSAVTTTITATAARTTTTTTITTREETKRPLTIWVRVTVQEHRSPFAFLPVSHAVGFACMYLYGSGSQWGESFPLRVPPCVTCSRVCLYVFVWVRVTVRWIVPPSRSSLCHMQSGLLVCICMGPGHSEVNRSPFAFLPVSHAVGFACLQVSGPHDIDVSDTCAGVAEPAVQAEKTYTFTVSCVALSIPAHLTLYIWCSDGFFVQVFFPMDLSRMFHWTII